MYGAAHLGPKISRRHPSLLRTDSPPPSSPSPSHSLGRRQPPLWGTKSTSSCASKAGEVCGGTTAECAAVWCCCPCGLVNLLVLAIYKVPGGLCRRALRNRRRRRLVKSDLLPPADGRSELESAVHPISTDGEVVELKIVKAEEADEAVAALEKEMWDRFYGAGFWRSPSQKEEVASSPRTGLLRRPSQSEAMSIPSPRVSCSGLFRSVPQSDMGSPRILIKQLG